MAQTDSPCAPPAEGSPRCEQGQDTQTARQEHTLRWWPAAGTLVAVYAAMLWSSEVGRSPQLLVPLAVVAHAPLLWISLRAGSSRLPTAVLLGVGLVARLLVVPLHPSLSDDVYRYLWDGRVLLAGENPYALSPDAPQLEPLRNGGSRERGIEEGFALVAHRDVETVYPPLAIALFALSDLLPHPLLSYKLLLVVIDLLGCWLSVRLAHRSRLPIHRLVWYAWSPLAVLEGAGMGHVDVVGVPCVVAAVLLLWRGGVPASPGRKVGAGACAGLGILVKLVPVVALPLWARRGGWRLLAAALAIAVVGAGGVVWSVGGVPPGLVRYGVSWEFNGPLFEPLWRVLRVLHAAPAVKILLEQLKQLSAAEGWRAALDRLFPFVYPQFLAKTLLAFGLMLFLALGQRGRFSIPATRRALGGALVFSATAYPWYFLWMLPFAALERSVPWLLLAASLPLAYLPRFWNVAYFPWVYLMVWLPPLVALVVAHSRDSRRVGGREP